MFLEWQSELIAQGKRREGKKDVPPRKMVATLFYGFCAFDHEISYKTWTNEEGDGVE